MPMGFLLRASFWKRISMKSPVSSICLVACVKRASSRSSGGIEASPGTYISKHSTTRMARGWASASDQGLDES
jgi:hypothetical protein